jgi:hypothetical protein
MRMKPLVCLLMGALAWAGDARYARLGEFRGQVEVQLGAAEAWVVAERNLPLVEGAWLRTARDARVEIELDDSGVWRLGPDSLGEISDYTRLSTGQHITLLTLDHGRAYFTGGAVGNDSLILAVPGAQVGLQRAAKVRLDVEPDASRISVLEGPVRFSSPAAELNLVSGQTARVEPADPARFALDRDFAAADQDAWSADRDRALAGPISALNVAERYGLADLDASGEWIRTEETGPVWKPRVGEAWAPFQNGRWAWYASLGFTWVSSDAWGWLPYHHGRWAHSAELGWAWMPGGSQVFKPGEVYWLRGAKFVGWGALAPGEAYPPQPDGAPPQQFLDAYTTYAAFTTGASIIDPAGFTGRPKEPLKVAAFCAALPSPPLAAARLDAQRPVLAAGGARVQPLLAGVAYQSAIENEPSPPPAPEAPPAPVEPSAPAIADVLPDQPDDGGTAAEPYSLLVMIQRAARKPRVATTVKPKTPSTTVSSRATPAPARTAPSPAPRPPVVRRWLPGEYPLYQRALADSADVKQQLVDLEVWRQRYPTTEYEADRTCLYLEAFNRFAPQPSDKAVEFAAPLLERDPHTWFEDSDAGRAQALAVLYMVAASAPRLTAASSSELRTCHKAAHELLAYLPEFWGDSARPSGISQQLWEKARADMESAANQALALRSAPPADKR